MEKQERAVAFSFFVSGTNRHFVLLRDNNTTTTMPSEEQQLAEPLLDDGGNDRFVLFPFTFCLRFVLHLRFVSFTLNYVSFYVYVAFMFRFVLRLISFMFTFRLRLYSMLTSKVPFHSMLSSATFAFMFRWNFVLRFVSFMFM